MPNPPKRPPTSGTRRGNGAGWGGEAKGSGTGGEPVAFEAGNRAAVGHGPVRPEFQATRESMMKVYETVATDEAAPHMARIMAADKWLDRTEGKPIGRNVNVNVDDLSSLSDADIAAELARLGGSRTEAAAGDATPGSPPRLAGVVH